MLFEKIDRELAIANKEFNISKHKAQAIVECAAFDAAIQMEEAEFKVFQESGEDDVLIVMYEEAEEGLIAKIQRGIGVVVEGIKKFFSALKDKIISIFKKKEVEESIKEIGLKAKLPFFKTQKVEVKDVDGEMKVLDKFKAKYQALLSKVKSGGSVADEEITETRESFLKEHAVAAGVSIGLTLTAAIALLLKYHKSLDSDVSETETDATKELGKLADLKGVAGEKVEQLIKLANGAADVAKSRGTAAVQAVSGLIAKIKAKVLKKTDVNDDKSGGFKSSLSADEASAYGESAEDDKSIFDSSEFSFMKESGEEKANQESEYNSDWIKTVFGD